MTGFHNMRPPLVFTDVFSKANLVAQKLYVAFL